MVISSSVVAAHMMTNGGGVMADCCCDDDGGQQRGQSSCRTKNAAILIGGKIVSGGIKPFHPTNHGKVPPYDI